MTISKHAEIFYNWAVKAYEGPDDWDGSNVAYRLGFAPLNVASWTGYGSGSGTPSVGGRSAPTSLRGFVRITGRPGRCRGSGPSFSVRRAPEAPGSA